MFILTNQDFCSCCGGLKMIKSRLLEWITRFWCFFILPCILSERILNMDELSTCGQKIEVFETPVIINARSSITPSSPSPYCQVILETTSRDGAYRLQITIKSVAIKDSTFMLRIYDGQGALNLLRQIGTSSKSTDIIYTKSSFATIILTQSTNIKYSENDFTLEVKGYRDPDEDEPVVGGSKLSPGAIVGIILAILLLIGFGTVLCYMYNTGIFTKKRSVSSQSVVGSKESLSKTPSSISSISSKKGYSENEHKDFHSAFLSSISMKVSHNSNQSRSDSSHNQRSSHPKMPPSRAEVKTISDKDVYEEPISTRRFGKTSSVTFDTRQQEPPYFQRSYAGGIQNGQRSPKSSLAKSKYGIPDRSSGHSNASYAEIKDLPDMMSNLKSQETSLRGSSQTQKEQKLPTAPRLETQNSRSSPRSSLYSSSRDTGNDLTSEDSSHLSIQKETVQKKQKAALLKEINALNSGQKREFSNSDAAEKGKTCGKAQEVTYSIVNKKPKTQAEMSANHVNTLGSQQDDSFQSENTNFITVPEAVINMPSNLSLKKQSHQPLSSSSEICEEEKFPKNPSSSDNDEEEDENDREVRNIHAHTASLYDETSSYDKELSSKPDMPTLMMNPLVNNTYIRHSVDDPSVLQKDTNNHNTPNKKHPSRRDPQNGFEVDNRNSESNGITPNHPHYGIPELVEKTPQIPINDEGFPSAFNAILSRTVRPDPNKTIEYGYHTQTNKSDESVSGKAAWYIESAPTKSGPIKTSAFFLQTSHPTQKNESVYKNVHYPNNQPMTNGNQFGPEHTSTPVSTFQPGGHVIKPKAKPRNRSTTENSKDRFPLSISQTEEGLSKAVPGQKSAVVKSGYDPSTGCQTTQVLWTDSIPDPTDPEPGVDNPCITRKTINRITTRSTYGNLPENPFPLLNQIQMESNEPSFLSPSVVSQHNMLPSSEWVSEIPHSEEISFYTQSASNRTKVPIIHEANQKHHGIKDRITIT